MKPLLWMPLLWMPLLWMPTKPFRAVFSLQGTWSLLIHFILWKKKEDEPSYCWQLGSSDGALQDESNGKTLALEMFHKLRELEIKRRAHFPSPSITFGSKLSVMLAQRNLRDIHAIPMLPVRKEHVWKKQLPRSTRRRS
jgi:hypothetical protein